MNKKLMAAQKYRELGFNVIPAKEDKKPYIPWSEYQKRKVAPGEIEEWWKKYPDANPAIVTGSISNLTVLDIDTEQGWKAYNELSPANAPTVTTPSGGKHVYFLFNNEIKTGARRVNDWDYRSEGGYVLAPPSVVNGKTYKWDDNGHILKTSIPKVFENILAIAIQSDIVGTNLANSYNSYTSTIIQRSNTLPHGCNNPITVSNKSNSIPIGQRDQILFHLANVLVRGGMPEDNILYYLKMFWNNCCEQSGELYTERELEDKIRSAFKRHTTLTMGAVEEWVQQQFGNFLVTDGYNELQLQQLDKAKLRVYLRRLVDKGVIEPSGNRSGQYRVIDKIAEPENWLEASTETCDLKLPFGLGDMVHLMPGDIVLVSGVPGVGKTAVLLNAAIENKDDYNVHYFSSELRPGTFKRRLEKGDTPVQMFKSINFYQRYDNYHDVIKSGVGNLNVVDYVKVLDNFYIIGKILAEIAKKLDGAMAIVSLQKQYGAKTGLGGMFSQFEPVLSINLDRGDGHTIATIAKTKEYKEDYIEKFGNADGFEYHFKIVSGIKIIKVRYWHKPFEGV